MAIRIYFQPYAEPGNVELVECQTPATVGEFITKAGEAVGSGKSNFIEVEPRKTEGVSGGTGSKQAVNVLQVQRVIPVT